MIKKMIRGMGVMVACLFLFPISVLATDKSVTLSEVENGVQACVEIPSIDTINPVTSLQLEFQVKITKGNAQKTEAEFHFSEGIKNNVVVKEYRYHPDTGILSIYLSGKENLFSNKLISDQKLDLGNLIVSSKDDLGVTAQISVVEDSYKVVWENGTKVEKESLNASGFVEIKVGNGGEPPVTPPGEEEPPVTPPGEEEPPVTPPGEEEPPVTPPDEEEPPVTPPDEEEPPVTPPDEENPPVSTPENPPDLQGGGGNVSGTQSQNTPAKTGDGAQPMRYLLIATVALSGMILLGIHYRRQKRQ